MIAYMIMGPRVPKLVHATIIVINSQVYCVLSLSNRSKNTPNSSQKKDVEKQYQICSVSERRWNIQLASVLYFVLSLVLVIYFAIRELKQDGVIGQVIYHMRIPYILHVVEEAISVVTLILCDK